MNRDRVKFFSVTDWGSGFQIEKAEIVLKNFDDKKEYNVIDLIEFYNITQYIDNKMYLKKWNNDDIEKIKKITNNMKKKIHIFFNSKLSNDNFEFILEQVSNEYMDDFFEIINQHIQSINISNNIFKKAIKEKDIFLLYILTQKQLVNKYSNEIKDIMIEKYMESARIIIEKYYLERNSEKDIYIPKTLTMQDIEEILINYINNEQVHSRYVELLSKDNKNGIALSDKTKLLAKKKSEKLKEEIFKNGIKFEIGYLVTLDNEMSEFETKKEEYKNGEFKCMYSKKWLENNLDYPTLLNNFIYLFNYTDIYSRIQLVNFSKQAETFESIMRLNAKNSYNPNSIFNSKRYLSLLQFKLYYEYLKNKGIRMEEIIEWFFNKYLVEEFNIKNYSISMPSEKSNYFEKCKSLLPEFDHILKEYKLFVEEGSIDQELVTMSSGQMFFRNIPSLINNKYVYLSNNNDNQLILYYLFSDQCMLIYLQRFTERYRSFCEVIVKEKVKYEEYNDYNKKILDWLIDKQIIFIDKGGYIQIKNINRVTIYKELNDKEVICYWRNSGEKRKEIDKMLDEGLLEVGNSLFSRNEQDYFDYYLNKSKFVDGYDIRNSNLHGTQEGDNKSDIHYSNYLQIMILLVLIIIKINDELCLYNSENYDKK